MKYFLDTEFLEGTQKQLVTNTYLVGFAFAMIIGGIIDFIFNQDLLASIVFIVTGCIYFYLRNTKIDTKPTIDLISIGIVSEDNREYYAISKDFNLKEAWNRCDIKTHLAIGGEVETEVYWIRDNVLKPIFIELLAIENSFVKSQYSHPESKKIIQDSIDKLFTYKKLKQLINKYGKSNKEIAEEIKDFALLRSTTIPGTKIDENLQFYTYYGAYDWVVFCWLFGKMIDLPKGFPMFSRDLKVMLDDKVNNLNWLYLRDTWNNSRMSINTIGKGDSQEKDRLATFDEKLKRLKELDEYPKQTNEHNALDDAKWNKKLYEFINTI
jgi:hypothetical protein